MAKPLNHNKLAFFSSSRNAATVCLHFVLPRNAVFLNSN